MIGGQNRNSDRSDTLSFDQGTLVTTSVVVGDNGGNANASAQNNTWTSTLNLGGGSTTVGSGGIDIGRADTAVTGTDIVNGNINLFGDAIVTVANNAVFGAAIRLGENVASSTVAANGNLTIAGTSSLTVSGDIIKGASTGVSSGVMTLNGGSLNMNGNFIGSGTSPINFIAQSGTLSNLAGINGTGALIKSTGGMLTLAGASTYTGATQINGGILNVAGPLSGTGGVTVNNTGTLLLSANNVINDSAGVTLNGGTLRTDGASEGSGHGSGLGLLTLSASSVIDFGTGGVATLSFAGFASHTAGTTSLTVDNWSGMRFQSGTEGARDRLILAGNAGDFRSAFAQNDILFSGFSPGYSAIQFDPGHYEIVAVPEHGQTAMAGAVALCALIGYRERRRFAFPKGKRSGSH